MKPQKNNRHYQPKPPAFNPVMDEALAKEFWRKQIAAANQKAAK